jgi:hypothetical protein
MKAKITYVDFQKKSNITEKDIYNTQYDKWIDIKRAHDSSKTIAHEAISYIAAIEFLFLKNCDEVVFNSNLLKKKSHHQQKQRGRFLKQIADLYEIKYHKSYYYKGKKLYFVWSATRTKNSLEILENPASFYQKMVVKNDLSNSQICPLKRSNLTALYIDNRNTIEEKDIALGYISFSKDIPNARARATETENATCENAILTEPSQIAIPESKKNITDSDQLEEIPIMQQEETVLSEKETRKMQLSKAIFDNFGMSANAIQDNCQFEELSLDKISVKPNAGVSFDDIEKNKIRKCIKEVYGEKITILTRINKLVLKSPTEIANNNFESKVLENANWQCLKRNLHRSFLKRYEEKYADHIIKNWFSKLTVSNDSDNKRLVLVGDCFVIDRIYQEYLTFLEQAMIDSDFSVELHFENNTERPIILTN